MEIQIRKTNQALLQATLYINSGEVPPDELKAIETLLEFITAGNATSAISEKQKTFSDLRTLNIRYFSKNPHARIIIVGDCRIKSQILVGMFQSFGIERKNLQTFTNYDQLVKIFPFTEIKSKHTKAVLLGSVPHSVAGLNGYESPKQALEAISQESGILFKPAQNLKITKEAVQEFIINVSKHLQSKSP